MDNGFTYDELWIQDQLYVKGNITQQLIDDLLAFPEVTKITENELTLFREPLGKVGVFERQAPLAEWGVEKIRAELAIEYLNNMTDPVPEIRLCTIDSGVRGTHESLRDNFLGQHGWFDPTGRTTVPYDDGGHGTHTTGTMSGSMGIGVYPDSKWMACVGCEDVRGFCSLYAMIRCGQWVVCPTLVDGDSGMDCSKAPHIVSNSWGVTETDIDWYDAVIDAWNVGGLVPIFSMGNSGSACSTTGYPGRLDVIGVGSTTSTDAISTFSSRGPTADGVQFKPDISAPGSAVVSASHLSDTGYRSLSGTIMACPHAAGLAGILAAYKPDLTLWDIREAMNEGAVTTGLTSPISNCGGIPDTIFPNHVFGHGRVDAMSSLEYIVTKHGKKE